VESLTADNQALRQEQARLSAESARLAQEKRSSDEALAAARRAPAPPAEWAQERQTLRGQVEDMFNQLAEAERRAAQSAKAESTARAAVQAANEQNEKARADLAALQTHLAEVEREAEQHGSSVAELTGLNERLTTEKAALQAQLAQLNQNTERSRSDAADLRARLAATERVAEQSARSLDELEHSNQALQTQVTELTTRLTALQSDNERLNRNSVDVTALRSEIATATAARTTLQNQVAQLTAQTEQARAEAGQAQAAAEQRAANIAAASNQLAAAQREILSLRGDNTRLSESVQALERDRAARIGQLQQENAALVARLRQAQGTLDQIASAARIINAGAAGYAAGQPRTDVPSAIPASAAPTRVHTVSEGDSLSRISVRYYGTANRWQEIYDANRELLRGENSLRPGQRLRIP
jgi:chromosome segregation ATPase